MDPVSIAGYSFIGALVFSGLFAYFYWTIKQSPEEGYAPVPVEVVTNN